MTQQAPNGVESATAPAPIGGPILLATEFGAVSSGAERVAIRLAAQAGVPLLIVSVIDPGRLRLPGGRFAQRIDQARATRQADAAGLINRVRAAGIKPQLLIWDGDPATCILEASRAEGAARIVMGSHGRGRIGRALVGRVSATVSDRADCPVDIVRDDGATEDVVTVSHGAHRA